MRLENVELENPGELPSFGTLMTLASAFLPNLGAGFPRLVSAPPDTAEDESMEARAQKAEMRYKSLVEQIPVVTFMVSFGLRKSEIYVSPYVEKLLGYTAKEWTEDPILWYQRLYTEDRRRWNAEFSRTIALAEPFKGDYRFLAKNGRIVWIHGEVTVVRDAAGRPSFLQGIGYEITELKLAEEVLRRSQEDLDQLVKARTVEIMTVNKSLESEIALRERVEENMRQSLKDLADVKSALDEHAIVAITDPKGKITYANDKFCAISKYSREELMGQDHRLINSGFHPREFMRDLWAGITQGKVWKGEILNRAKDGTLYWVDTTIVPFLGIDGKPAQYVAIRADITERKRAQERQNELMGELKEINEQLNQFAYVVSHDLKAPLRAISSLADWLITDYGDKVGEAGREQFAMLLGRTKRMNSLVDGILRYSRITRQHEEQVTVDVNVLLREVSEMLSPPPGMVLHIAPGLPTVQCERTRLTQVFENLISNAVKYMGKPAGDIYVGCEDAGRHWKFSVRDTGPGIEERYFEKIFQIFQTLAARDDRESTGIGLAIVKKNVELSGGRVWVESKPGEGSAFFFLIPKSSANTDTSFLIRSKLGRGGVQDNTLNPSST
ncbi:MAG TPA: PAS domain-containing protein [Candidatus Saccharimonadales bacterium]|nr:PAS domain-containing protein [Candidatus Saccharimonadales bacterium]